MAADLDAQEPTHTVIPQESQPDSPEESLFEADDQGELLVDPRDANKISLDKNDRSLSDFVRWWEKGRLVLDPEWQRRYVWDKKRASRLVESLLIDLPVPVIYLAVNDDSKYEVIDGLQRLTSVIDFLTNKYPLTGLEIRSDLNGKTFGDLPAETQGVLEDKTLRTFELANRTPKDLMFLIFERLNTGGVALNDMEIRNCLYRGGMNDLIKELAGNEDLIKSVHQKNLFRRMDDRTLVLRFLAFYQLTYKKARKGLKAFLNEFFETYRNPSPAKTKEYRDVFKKSMRACYTVFGNNAYRLRRVSDAGGGEWASKPNGSVFQVVSVSFTDYDLSQVTRARDAIFEAFVDLVSTDSKWVDVVTASTGDYLRIEYAFETWQARLREAIKDYPANDGRRLFSAALKKELFAQDSTCAICGQRIVSTNDAALDHDVQYWLGGKTVPENARLVHRQCNWERARKDKG